MKRLALLFLLAALIFLGKLVRDAGAFHKVNPHGFASCTSVADLPGPEDMAYSPALKQLILSSDTRPDAGSEPAANGQLFGLDPEGRVRPLAEGMPLPFHPHGIDVLPLGGKDRVFVVNHRSPRESVVELFESEGGKLRYLRTFSDPALLTPNDIAATGPESFYVTQDHGSTSHLAQAIEHFTRIPRGSLGYFTGNSFTMLVRGIGFANGIARDPARRLLYVAATTEKGVRIYSMGASANELTYLRAIPLPAGPDNLSLDPSGSLWIGAHPNLFALKRHSEHHKERAPALVLRVAEPWGDNPRLSEEMEDDGRTISAVSVALPWGKKVLLGGIYDAKLLSCQARE